MRRNPSSRRATTFMPRHERMAAACVWAGVCAAFLANGVRGAELTIANFNNQGMNWTWGNFLWSAGATSTRIYDPVDSTGGAGRSTPGLNLSTYADGRWVIDVTENAGNGSDAFYLAIEDTSGRRGTWALNAVTLQPGTPAQLVSQTTLANPTGGNNQASLDLSHISFFQIDGQYGNPLPFDMSFDNIAVSTTVAPPPAYAGQEPDAAWRAVADQRIDQIRKADLSVRVVDAAGQPLPGATVNVAMQQHEFGFGSAVNAVRLRDDNPAHATYKQKVAELFNIATLENDLKWPPWNGEWGSNFTQAGAHAAVDWLQAHEIKVRGHNIIWPGYNNLPANMKAILDGRPLDAAEQATLRATINAHIDDIAGQFAGDLYGWDVVNEPWDNHDVMDSLPEGNAAMADWFERTRAADPNVGLFLNDYNILSTGGSTNTAKQQFYYDTAEDLIDAGAPITGLGFQGHFNVDSLTGPEQLWQILDRYQQLGLDMQITEFDVGTNDEQLQADYTRDFLTAVFAHEGIDAFTMWGFWENATYIPQRAMFRSDWSIKPNGQEYVDLVFNQWWTSEQLESDLSGDATLRGFKGKYEITVIVDGKTVIMPATLSDGGLVLDVAVPTLAADFDASGTVDDVDLGIWKSNIGQPGFFDRSQGDADGNGAVDGADLLVWQRQLGRSVPPDAAATAPEPASDLILLVLVAWLLFVASRWRNEFCAQDRGPSF